MTRSQWVRSVWARVTEPKSVTVAQMVTYAVMVAVGILQLVDPSMIAATQWDKTFTVTWAWVLIGGGGIGAISAPYGYWWAERIGVIACIGGLVMYLTALLQEGVTVIGGRAMIVGLAVTTVIALIIRYLRIRGSEHEPGR